MRREIRPTMLRAIEIAEELMPAPCPDLTALPPTVRVQSSLFDALVLLAEARREAHGAPGGAMPHWAASDIDELCDALDALISRIAS